MTDLVAPPISSAAQAAVIPQGMGITPADWQVVLGIPLWIFIDAILLFALAAVFVWWIAKIRKLDAVKGWSESLKNMDVNDVQVWLVTRTQKLIIGCMKIEDNVLSYHDTTKIGMWHHNSRESVIRVGGNPAVLVSEDYDQTRDVVTEIALTDNCDAFNANQETLKKEHEESGDTSEVIAPINNYLDYEKHGRKALQLVHPDGLPMKSYNVFSCIRFMKYFPLGCSHMFFGGELTFDARYLHPNKSTKGFWEKHIFLMVAAIVALGAIAAAWFVPLR